MISKTFTKVNGMNLARSALQKSAHHRIFATAMTNQSLTLMAEGLSSSFKDGATFKWSQGYQFQSLRSHMHSSSALQEELPIMDEQAGLEEINRLSRLAGRPMQRSAQRRFAHILPDTDNDSFALTRVLRSMLLPGFKAIGSPS